MLKDSYIFDTSTDISRMIFKLVAYRLISPPCPIVVSKFFKYDLTLTTQVTKTLFIVYMRRAVSSPFFSHFLIESCIVSISKGRIAGFYMLETIYHLVSLDHFKIFNAQLPKTHIETDPAYITLLCLILHKKELDQSPVGRLIIGDADSPDSYSMDAAVLMDYVQWSYPMHPFLIYHLELRLQVYAATCNQNF
ncbi:hypothetical protein ACJX0J_025828 [Zea mays]